MKSIVTRVQSKFGVSVAEIDSHDSWKLATIGICCISNDKRHANKILSRVVDFITESRFEVELLDYEIELLTVF